MPRDKETKKTMGELLYERACDFARETPHDCKKLLTIIEKSQSHIKTAFQHSDFTPWHVMIIPDNRLSLIDGEHATNRALHYDAAYFYHRIYTTLQKPEYARKFLKVYRKSLNKDLKRNFEADFLPVLAQRVIGGYFDVERDERVSKDMQDKIEKEVFGGKF